MSAPSRFTTVPGHERADNGDAGSSGARTQAVFRTVNEEISRVADGFAVDEALELVCECEHGNCFARLSLPRDEYEAIRRFPTRFLIRADHVGPDERVVHERDGYAVVEKTGPGAETAILSDPRKQMDNKAAT